MRTFTDPQGRGWTALARETEGPDYKGRFLLVFRGPDGAVDEVSLDDVRWNSERDARRTVETMSEVELRRRLRAALGRVASPAAF